MHQTVNSPYSNTANNIIQQYGTSNLPELFKYSKLIKYHKDLIKGIPCYTFQHYGYDGLSVLIYRKPKLDSVVVVCGDWFGNKIDVSNSPETAEFLNNNIVKICETIRMVGLEQVQLFFTNNKELVDIQLSPYKFASPGMLSDIFNNACKIFPHKKFEIIDDRVLNNIESSMGDYGGDLIIKPSKFRATENGPMYIEVIR